MQKRKIILASSSPRRKQLLEQIGLKFKIHPSSYEEDMTLKKKSKDLAKFLSAEKAKDVAQHYKDEIIIAADTFIVYKDKVLGKPKSKADAVRTLQMLNGNTHQVITGLTLIDTKKEKMVSVAISSKVTFRKSTNCQLKAYVDLADIMDKAGSYAIQGLGAVLVSKIEGDYFNIVGMPLEKLTEILREEFRVNLLSH